MNCKNCKDPLEENAHFCDNCGAKVIKSRITFKLLIIELFTNVFGVDSKFFITLKKMFTQPQEVINEYLTGVRKRYVNPFAYLAVGAAISLITFNFFSDDFIRINSSFNKAQNEEMYKLANADSTAYIGLNKEELTKFKAKQKNAQVQVKFQKGMMDFMLNYFNLLAFLLLPIYALVSKLTYFKPYNFGEHIVINAYLQGSTMYISVSAFLISLVSHPLVYTLSVFTYIIYYLFTFAKLYNHSIGKTLLKLLRFIGIMLTLGIVLFIIGIIVTLIITFLF